ncbi:MAG: hypothetical protein IJK89_07070 [Clostridia bacterium]|nr:hypothetical protein [Clostridia bacterium]
MRELFGFVVANPEKLNEEQRAHYRAVYCGLCRALGKEHGFIDRLTLTYDLAFLILVLSAVEGEPYESLAERCPIHPSKHTYAVNRFTSYAASMNVALSYYKFLDDKNDEGSMGASVKAAIFRKEALAAAEQYPDQCKAITECLDKLSAAEKADVLMPDIPAGIFGELMGALFAVDGLTQKDALYDFGCALGKAVYVMDAAADRKKDLKKKQYNPLVMLKKEEIKTILDILMADVVEQYKKLTVSQDAALIENVLYSGIWTVYAGRMRKENGPQPSEEAKGGGV